MLEFFFEQNKTSQVLVIITTYNGEKWIENCLVSIYSSSFFCDVLCIDNCSTDNTLQFIQSNFPLVIVLKNKFNSGFGFGNNIGLRYAIEKDYEYVFLLNQDTQIFPTTLELLYESALKIGPFGFLSPIHLGKDNSSFEPNFEYFLHKSFKRNVLSNFFFRDDSTPFIEIDFVNAAAWFLSVDTIKKVGGFNSIFPHYSEDLDYGNRLKYYGFKNYLVLNSLIHHFSEPPHNLNFKKQLNREFFERVAVLTNINFSFLYLWREVFLNGLVNFLYAFYPFRFEKIKFELLIFLKLIFNSRKIFRVRMISKSEKAFLR